jgi:hypothetical protein
LISHDTAKTKNPGCSRDFKAGLTGLEPATSYVTGRHSNRLSYSPNALFYKFSRMTAFAPVATAAFFEKFNPEKQRTEKYPVN